VSVRVTRSQRVRLNGTSEKSQNKRSTTATFSFTDSAVSKAADSSSFLQASVLHSVGMVASTVNPSVPLQTTNSKALPQIEVDSSADMHSPEYTADLCNASSARLTSRTGIRSDSCDGSSGNTVSCDIGCDRASGSVAKPGSSLEQRDDF